MNAGSTRFTLDTNLLVYAIDSAAGIRHDLAREIVRHAVRLDCWLTLQAVSEFYVVASRKRIVPPPDAAAKRASYWDALLLATAGEAGCLAILTEDLADGGELGGVRIYNPFAAAGGFTDQACQLLGL